MCQNKTENQEAGAKAEGKMDQAQLDRQKRDAVLSQSQEAPRLDDVDRELDQVGGARRPRSRWPVPEDNVKDLGEWAGFLLPAETPLVFLSHGHTSTTALEHYLNIPFTEEDRIERRSREPGFRSEFELAFRSGFHPSWQSFRVEDACKMHRSRGIRVETLSGNNLAPIL